MMPLVSIVIIPSMALSIMALNRDSLSKDWFLDVDFFNSDCNLMQFINFVLMKLSEEPFPAEIVPKKQVFRNTGIDNYQILWLNIFFQNLYSLIKIGYCKDEKNDKNDCKK